MVELYRISSLCYEARKDYDVVDTDSRQRRRRRYRIRRDSEIFQTESSSREYSGEITTESTSDSEATTDDEDALGGRKKRKRKRKTNLPKDYSTADTSGSEGFADAFTDVKPPKSILKHDYTSKAYPNAPTYDAYGQLRNAAYKQSGGPNLLRGMGQWAFPTWQSYLDQSQAQTTANESPEKLSFLAKRQNKSNLSRDQETLQRIQGFNKSSSSEEQLSAKTSFKVSAQAKSRPQNLKLIKSNTFELGQKSPDMYGYRNLFSKDLESGRTALSSAKKVIPNAFRKRLEGVQLSDDSNRKGLLSRLFRKRGFTESTIQEKTDSRQLSQKQRDTLKTEGDISHKSVFGAEPSLWDKFDASKQRLQQFGSSDKNHGQVLIDSAGVGSFAGIDTRKKYPSIVESSSRLWSPTDSRFEVSDYSDTRRELLRTNLTRSSDSLTKFLDSISSRLQRLDSVDLRFKMLDASNGVTKLKLLGSADPRLKRLNPADPRLGALDNVDARLKLVKSDFVKSKSTPAANAIVAQAELQNIKLQLVDSIFARPQLFDENVDKRLKLVRSADSRLKGLGSADARLLMLDNIDADLKWLESDRIKSRSLPTAEARRAELETIKSQLLKEIRAKSQYLDASETLSKVPPSVGVKSSVPEAQKLSDENQSSFWNKLKYVSSFLDAFAPKLPSNGVDVSLKARPTGEPSGSRPWKPSTLGSKPGDSALAFGACDTRYRAPLASNAAETKQFEVKRAAQPSTATDAGLRQLRSIDDALVPWDSMPDQLDAQEGSAVPLKATLPDLQRDGHHNITESRARPWNIGEGWTPLWDSSRARVSPRGKREAWAPLWDSSRVYAPLWKYDGRSKPFGAAGPDQNRDREDALAGRQEPPRFSNRDESYLARGKGESSPASRKNYTGYQKIKTWWAKNKSGGPPVKVVRKTRYYAPEEYEEKKKRARAMKKRLSLNL